MRGCWRSSYLKRLPKSFYERDALVVAHELIGCVFLREEPSGICGVRLVETEAYRGPEDPGSHGYRGTTPRTEVMYGPPARLYVYFTYGMHWCVNIVCAPAGVCSAVLLRAGEPVEGIQKMWMRRGAVKNERSLASGPARLAQALGIAKAQNGESLLRGGAFWCAEDSVTDEYRQGEISQTARIGLSEGRGDDLPWRFVVPGHPYASRKS